MDDARRLELHLDPYWRTLLHYKGGLFGFRSLVDDPRFFAAENGKHDSAAELEATIRSFFTPPGSVAAGEKHPICRFVARYNWLKDKLGIDPARLPLPSCAPFDALMESIQPQSVTLIFPTSHMNSPASMYGHTLITVRTIYDTDLLSYAINYSAESDETFGPFYIAKGLVGQYKGYFSILPYYAKLQEYSDVNDRDIWEYPLALDAGEVRRLLMHTYEMESIYADYFFFNENCSYDLLFLIDAARPGLHLTDETGWWVIPLDTIRELKRSGLVRDAVYRPSKSTKIHHLASLLPEERRREAVEIAHGRVEPAGLAQSGIDSPEAITTLDLASEYLQYQYAKKELSKEEYTPRFLKTLKARSELGEPSLSDDRQIAIPTRPDEGHHSNRFALGFGADDDRVFEEIRLRPAYHTLLDDDAGYKRGSQIIFGDVALRYYSTEGKLELEAIDIIDIVSIAPRDDFFKHTSWKIRTDLFRRSVRDDRDYLVYRLNPGFGLGYASRVLGLWYGMIETDLQIGGVLDPNYSWGAGGSTGVVKNLTDSWKIHAYGRDVYHLLGDEDNQLSYGIGQNLRMTADMSIAIELEASRNDHDSGLESVVRWNAFF